MEHATRRVIICSRCTQRIVARNAARRFSRYSSRSTAIETTSTNPSVDDTVLAQDGSSAGNYNTSARTRRQRVLQQQLGENSLRFEEMPFQCFQEARKYLLEDRNEKLQQIQTQRERMTRLQAQDVAPQNEASKKLRLTSMRRRLDELKILADINDPLVKKKFEDGDGDMTKPIYRHLAERKWREYERKIVEQRITQMNVVPDVLPEIDLSVSVKLGLVNRSTRSGRKMQHGEILPSADTEFPPSISIQPFDRGARLYTIAVVNPDVPEVVADTFTSRCHFLAVNVPITPSDPLIDLANLSEHQLVQSWLPAYAQKGLAYQRMAVFVLEQPLKEEAESDPRASRSRELDAASIKASEKYGSRDGFSLRALTTRYRLKPVGADLYRTVWDEGTAGVMERAGVVGADVEFQRKRVEPLPYKRMSSVRYR